MAHVENHKRLAWRMTSRARYLASQKLSDYQIEKIIYGFAKGVSATDLLKATGKEKVTQSANTVFDIYDMLRQRLFDIGVFRHPDHFFDDLNDPEFARHYAFSETARELGGQMHRLNGMSERTTMAHIAEALFRAQHPYLTPDAFFRDIKLAIKMTGPLNRPPEASEVWAELSYIMTYQRMIDRTRNHKSLSGAAARELVAGLERIIEAAMIRLRRAKRQPQKGKPTRSANTIKSPRKPNSE